MKQPNPFKSYLIALLLLSPFIVQANPVIPNPTAPNPIAPQPTAPKPTTPITTHPTTIPYSIAPLLPYIPQIGSNGRLVIPTTPLLPRYPTNYQDYFKKHKAYEYGAGLSLQEIGRIAQSKGYTLYSNRAFNEIASVLSPAPLWPEWAEKIREVQKKDVGSIDTAGQLTTYYVQSKGDYLGYAYFGVIDKNNREGKQQTAFDAILPEINKRNFFADTIDKQNLTPEQRDKAWRAWDKQQEAAAPRKPTDEQRETWQKAVEYSQREAAIRANRSLPEQMLRDYGDHLDKTLDDTINRTQDTWNNFANGAPDDYSLWGKAAYYANNAWDATKTVSDGLYEAAGGNAAQSTAYDHYMPENGKQFIDKKLEQYQQWAAKHPEQNEFVKLAGNGIDALGAYKAAYPRHSPDFNLPHRDTTPPRIPSPDFTSNQHAPYNPAPYTPRTPDHQRQPNIPRIPDYQRQPNTPKTPDYQRHPNTPQKPDYNKPNTPHTPDHNKPTPNQIPFNPTKPDAPTPHKPDWQKPDLPTPRQPDFRKPNAPAPRKPDIHKQPSIPTPHKPNVNKTPTPNKKSDAPEPNRTELAENNKTCSFHGSTLVKTNTGYQPIANIKIGDQVLAKNELNGEINYKAVTAQYSNPYAQTVYIRIGDTHGKAQTLIANTIHPFYANGKWIPSGSLKTGDVLLSENGAAQTVQSVETKDEALTAYNLTVADFHTYFVKENGSGADAVWVHNDCDPADRPDAPKKEVVTTTLGNQIDITPSANHSRSPDGVVPPLVGQLPNSSVDIYGRDGTFVTRRFYDENGNIIRDVHMTDHGNRKLHPEVPHEHHYEVDKNGKPKRIK